MEITKKELKEILESQRKEYQDYISGNVSGNRITYSLIKK